MADYKTTYQGPIAEFTPPENWPHDVKSAFARHLETARGNHRVLDVLFPNYFKEDRIILYVTEGDHTAYENDGNTPTKGWGTRIYMQLPLGEVGDMDYWSYWNGLGTESLWHRFETHWRLRDMSTKGHYVSEGVTVSLWANDQKNRNTRLSCAGATLFEMGFAEAAEHIQNIFDRIKLNEKVKQAMSVVKLSAGHPFG